MLENIIIPSLGESISEVTISSLLVESGSLVKENQGILEVESEKINQVVYASSSGVIFWNVKVGDTVSIGAIVGTITQEETRLENKGSSLSSEVLDTDFLSTEEKQEKLKGEIIEFPGSITLGKDKVFVPLEHPLSYRSIKKEEKLHSFTESFREEKKPMTSLRRTISKRLVQSLRESAMLTTFNEINMDAVISLRDKYKETLLEKTQVRLGFMSFFIYAVTQALKEFPILNSYIEEDSIVYRKYYNIGVAVATEKGLLVPVIRDANRFSLIELEQQLAFLAKKARDGLLSIEDLSEGSFTITNAGVFGSLLSTPIINPPQVGILGMHKIEKRPVVINNEIKIAQMMYVALSYDHRIVDGKDAVSFLMKIKQIIENSEELNIT